MNHKKKKASYGRPYLTGKELDADCLKARVSHFEYGKEDRRVYCYGLCDGNEELLEKCGKCKAFVDNATPLKEELKNG